MARVVLLVLLGIPLVPGSVAQGLTDPQEVGLPVRESLRVPPDGTIGLRPFLVHGSLRVTLDGEILPDTSFVVDEGIGRLVLRRGAFRTGQVAGLSYRVLPLGIPPVTRLDRRPAGDGLDALARVRPSGRPAAAAPGAGRASVSGLRTRGAVTRGVMAGSGRDPALESGLRLEIDGSPAPGITVTAALTDESTPIRPDGTTERLDEFDRVAISITAPPGSVRLGDFDLSLAGGRFSRFSRRLQGVAAAGGGRLGGGVSARFQAAGAAARGHFRTQSIPPADGVQGPYRLEASDGSLFILVVPGSETVYMDGERLERGRHYTVDYATGEITFGPSRVVTSDRRITVEFSYRLEQYTRALVASEADVTLTGASGPWGTFGLSWLREADGDRFLEEFGLSAADSSLLAAVGDGAAFRSGARVVPFDPEAPYVQYRMDVRGPDSVFVALGAAPPFGEPVYRVTFTRVGEGLGRYARSGQSVNGIVYAWSPGGAYDAVRRITPPARRQLVDLRASLSPVAGIDLGAEWTRSIDDRNRLSSLDSDDDAGDALYVGLRAEPTPGLSGRLIHERIGAGFRAFDRIRDVEFARDWNLATRAVDPTSGLDGGEERTAFEAEWSPRDSTRIAGAAARMRLGSGFDADRLTLEASTSGARRIEGRLGISTVATRDDAGGESGRLLTHKGRLAAPESWRLRPFVETEFEHRRIDIGGGVLHPLSISYSEWRPGIAWTAASARVSADVERRRESWPLMGDLRHAAESWTTRGTVRWGSRWGGGLDVAYRLRKVEPAFGAAPGGSDTRALLVSAQGQGRAAERMSVEWAYEARTERTPTLQEVYFRAGPERGEFVWIDANADGVRQVDEFLPETTPEEGLYVRAFLPSDSLASVAAARARLRLSVEPGRVGPLSALSGQTLVEIEERSRTNRRHDVYLLRVGRFLDPGQTLDGRLRLRQDVSLFRGRPGFGVEASVSHARSLAELAAGIEERRLDAAEARVRMRRGSGPDWTLAARTDRNRNVSGAFASRRFDITTRYVAPSALWRAAPGLSLKASVEAAWKTDRLADRRARVLRVPVSARVSRAGRADVMLRLEATDARLDGTATGLAAWELTDGRGPGTSFLWGTTVQWSIGATLRATLSYDGRAPSAGAVIHTGRFELSALF